MYFCILCPNEGTITTDNLTYWCLPIHFRYFQTAQRLTSTIASTQNHSLENVTSVQESAKDNILKQLEFKIDLPKAKTWFAYIIFVDILEFVYNDFGCSDITHIVRPVAKFCF